jgi:hypothetical protein
MPAVLAPALADREPLLWLAPSPLWEGGDIATDQVAFEQPRLVELTTDDFLPEFLALLSGDDPAGPAALGVMAPEDGSGTASDPSVLYRPIHGRYYLVVGSLVCRRIGLPDREVKPKGQAVTFVVRRLTDGGEQARTRGGAWVAVADPLALAPGEEQHPMHPETVGVATGDGPAANLLGLDEPGLRQVHYGYVPVASLDAAPEPLADPVAALREDPDATDADDGRILEFRIRVAGPWSDIAAKKQPPASMSNTELREPSLYVLLDLRDYLATYLPDVLEALVTQSPNPLPTAPAQALRAKLDITITADGAPTKLGAVLDELEDLLPLLAGSGGTEPTTVYDISSPPGGLPTFVDDIGGTGTGGGLLLAALEDIDAPGEPAQVPAELQGLIVARPDDPVATADRYVLRLVYEHEPCEPVLSKPTPVVRFAGNYEPNAPARTIRIELPDPSQLRSFNRGIGLEMPPKLRNMLESVTPKILKEEKPGPEGGWELGMICSFSIQIIFLVAFIVMFIFLILLNIVFWWLPFLKICFPIPKKR